MVLLHAVVLFAPNQRQIASITTGADAFKVISFHYTTQ
jgi:hypothetical protein